MLAHYDNDDDDAVPALEYWSPPPKYKCEAPIIGGLGAEPPAVSWDRAPGQGVRRAKPPEAETLLAFGRLLKVANLPTLKKIEMQKVGYNLCCIFQK